MDPVGGRFRHLRRAAFLFAVGLGAFAAGAGATGAYRFTVAPVPSPIPVTDGRPVTNLRVGISTTATPVAGGRVAWASTWTLCWDGVPGAFGYEVQAMTSESVSPQLKRVDTPCFSVELAAGENQPADIPHERGVQLSTQRSQLAYRVRAVFGQNVVGAWSPAIDAGALGVK